MIQREATTIKAFHVPKRIFVGKKSGGHVCGQEEINGILLKEAKLGHQVVRLKGGDPFIFGRGGEERSFLLSHGITVDVVPGITAALGCGAATGPGYNPH